MAGKALMKRRTKMATKPEIHKMITKVNFTDAGRGKGQIKYLVKHYVGATGGAEANCNYFKNTYRGASAHYFVGHDGEIWQCVRDEDIAWHCGATSYKHKECRNSNSIGIELCVKKDRYDRWYYTDKTTQGAVLLFGYLMDKYSIDVNHVLRHYDVTGKICGEPDVRLENYIWNKFKKDIAAYGRAIQTSTPFKIKTTCDVLNIRAGAGTCYNMTGKIREKNGHKKKYTIVKTINGWGKLKNGKGWISLAYTKITS